MSGRRPTDRDRRRRELGQNFLVDRRFIRRFIDSLDLRGDELVVDLGAGSGALTIPLLDAGADVWAVERDPVWAIELRRRIEARSSGGAGRVITADLRNLRLPRVPFRVVANPPFGLTSDIMSKLLDTPERGPRRVDLVVQREVAFKHCRQPPTSLRTAAWSPWWEFRPGPTVGRDAFRPRPGVDAAVLIVERREPAVLPTWLGPRLRELLRPAWSS